MATAAKRFTWPLSYQLHVNSLVMDQQLRPRDGTDGLMTTSELAQLEQAAAAGESAESFVARVIAPTATPALSFHTAQRRLSSVLTVAGVPHTVTRPQLVRHREEDR